MYNLVNETKDEIKKLAHNTGISITNLLFAIELLFLFFSKNFDLPKIDIKQKVYFKFILHLYSCLYNWRVFLICCIILFVSLLLSPVPLPKFLEVTDGYANNTSRGFDLAAGFIKGYLYLLYS